MLAGATHASGALTSLGGNESKRIRTGVIGCGSVSHSYLPQLNKSPFVEVVSLCDIKPERACKQAEKFKVAHHYPNIDAMHVLEIITAARESSATGRRIKLTSTFKWPVVT